MVAFSGLSVFCLSACFFTVHAAGWADCDAKPATANGAYNHTFLSTVSEGTEVWVQYPLGALPQGKSAWPIIIFMHALNLGWEWYEPQVQRWASHGFVVIFPFIKAAAEDDTVTSRVEDTTGKNLNQALNLVRGIVSGSVSVPNGLQGNLDLTNMAWVGHNMGAVSAIRVAAASPKETVKLVVALHPFICDVGPPPSPYTFKSKELTQANNNAGLLFFTSENDKAFDIPLFPGTPAREQKCFGAAQGNAIFANFKGSVCDAYPDCKDMPENSPYGKLDCKGKFHALHKGHFCPCSAPMPSKWVSPEEQWVTTSLRTYLQQGMDVDSVCKTLLWGDGAGSLSTDDNIANKIVQRKNKIEIHV